MRQAWGLTLLFGDRMEQAGRETGREEMVLTRTKDIIQ